MDYKFQKYIEKQETEFLKQKVNGTDLIRISDANNYFNSYNKQLIIPVVINWVAYDWNKPSTRPPNSGRYLIYRSKCNKIHFEQWNGTGWSSSNNDCTHWTSIEPPCL